MLWSGSRYPPGTERDLRRNRRTAEPAPSFLGAVHSTEDYAQFIRFSQNCGVFRGRPVLPVVFDLNERNERVLHPLDQSAVGQPDLEDRAADLGEQSLASEIIGHPLEASDMGGHHGATVELDFDLLEHGSLAGNDCRRFGAVIESHKVSIDRACNSFCAVLNALFWIAIDLVFHPRIGEYALGTDPGIRWFMDYDLN